MLKTIKHNILFFCKKTTDVKLFYNILFTSLIIFNLFFVLIFISSIYTKYSNYNKLINYYEIKHLNSPKIIKIIYDNLKIKGYIQNKKLYFFDEYGNKKYALYFSSNSLIHLFKRFYLFQYNFIAIKSSNIKNRYYLFSFNQFLSQFLILSIIFAILLLIYLIILIFIFLKHFNELQKQKIFKIKNLNENTTFHTLVENLHHELSTPVNILKMKLDKFNIKLNKLLKKYENERICHITHEPCGVFDNVSKEINNLLSDKKIIETAFSQIDSIIYNMKDFKHIKLSNGDKTVYDLFYGAIRIVLALKNMNIKYHIDERLKVYTLNHNYNFSNGDLINIIVNLTKNSIEANATEIKVELVKEINKNKIEIAFIDNGSGIPSYFVNKIFEEDSSTKDSAGRGNGLYISKVILNSANNNIYLYKTSSEEGTEFRLILNVIKNSVSSSS